MRLSLYDYPDGVELAEGLRVVYLVGANEAILGAVSTSSHALVWEIGDEGHGALLSAEVELDPAAEWLVRCDRVEFPPGGVAYLHTHPGPGIRCLLSGSIRIETGGSSATHRPFEAWFERGPEPVFAAASADEETAFVRVMLLPREWEGKRTIRYVNPEDEQRPKLQRATVLLEAALDSLPRS
jgi:hypothetical protein